MPGHMKVGDDEDFVVGFDTDGEPYCQDLKTREDVPVQKGRVLAGEYLDKMERERHFLSFWLSATENSA